MSIVESAAETFQPNKLFIIAGTSSEFASELTVQVLDIIIAHSFNVTTLENDLAILRLNSNLPLGIRNDLKWVILDDIDNADKPCLANFYFRNKLTKIASCTRTEQLPLLPNSECQSISQYPLARRNDICSLYRLPCGFHCAVCNRQPAFDDFARYNVDRGVGLSCKNHLVGLLSTILPLPDAHNFNCSQKVVQSYYTNLENHLTWIYNVIHTEELEVLKEGTYTASSPYDGLREKHPLLSNDSIQMCSGGNLGKAASHIEWQLPIYGILVTLCY
uniref:Peptidase S1 domain-containing protein n=1 Tax=Glossina morsitans morsitans TaxID=37546 RepID=A0A1B0FN99_GLOMM